MPSVFTGGGNGGLRGMVGSGSGVLAVVVVVGMVVLGRL